MSEIMKTVRSKTKKIKRACIFGYPVDVLSRKKALALILRKIKHRIGIQVITINPEIINSADKNPELAEVMKKAELVIPESTGVMIALDTLYHTSADKIPGIELSEKLMKKCAKKGYKIAFLGGTDKTISLLNKEMLKMYPKLNIVFSHNGFFETDEQGDILRQIKEADPHLLLVGMGAPKQELFIDRNKDYLNQTVMIGVGGSFDIWAKKIRRAPVLFRFFGLEWLYRLITQPKRIRRMFPTLPVFF